MEKATERTAATTALVIIALRKDPRKPLISCENASNVRFTFAFTPL
ncbi:Uncharacterised protein [Chlamydia trachomatis]|nr:Uncharacterised protein [Chlamydia trachomatis]